MAQTERLTKRQELEMLFDEARKALNFPSDIMQKAHKFSNEELQNAIDERIIAYENGQASDEMMIEAQCLAIMQLRRCPNK